MSVLLTSLPRGDLASPQIFRIRANTLLQFIIAATPNDTLVVDILNDYDQIIAGMTSWSEAHPNGNENTILPR